MRMADETLGQEFRVIFQAWHPEAELRVRIQDVSPRCRLSQENSGCDMSMGGRGRI